MLVVEADADEDLVAITAEALRGEGWTVLSAGSVDEALGTAQEVAVDVVLADLKIDRPTGLELEQAFQRVLALSRIPFVFMTGYAPHTKDLPGKSVLLKPFSLEALCAALVSATAAGTSRRARDA